MASVVIAQNVTTERSVGGPPTWIFIVPLIFLACQGEFSFQLGGRTSGGFSPGAVDVRHPGIIGYVLIPGIAYGIIVWLMRRRANDIGRLARDSKLLSFLSVLTVASAIWSQNPLRSAVFGVLYCLCTLFAYYLVVTFTTRQIMHLVYVCGVSVSLASLLLVALAPDQGISHPPGAPGSWNGIFIDSRAAAKCLTFLLSPALVFDSGTSERPFRIFYIVFLGVMIVMTRAATPLVIIPAYLLLMGILRVRRALDARLTVAFAMTGFVVACIVLFVAYNELPDILHTLGRNATLTGRTEIWSLVLQSVSKRPLLGYGFYAFWQGLEGESGSIIRAMNWTFGYAHNGGLEILLQLGCLGGVCVIGTLFQGFRHAGKVLIHERHGIADWYIGILCLTLLYNIDESTVLWPNSLLSILYIVACCGLAEAASSINISGRNTEEQDGCGGDRLPSA